MEPYDRFSRGPQSARKSQILVTEVQGGPNTFILLGFVKPQKKLNFPPNLKWDPRIPRRVWGSSKMFIPGCWDPGEVHGYQYCWGLQKSFKKLNFLSNLKWDSRTPWRVWVSSNMSNLGSWGPWESIDAHIVGICEGVWEIWIPHHIWNGTLGPSGGSESMDTNIVGICKKSSGGSEAAKNLKSWLLRSMGVHRHPYCLVLWRSLKICISRQI